MYPKTDRYESRFKTDRTITAKCPQCDVIHKIQLDADWTGRGMPRIICVPCANRNRMRWDTSKWKEKQQLIKETNDD